MIPVKITWHVCHCVLAPLLLRAAAVQAQAPATVAPTAASEEVLALEADSASRMTVSVRLGKTAIRNFIVDTGADRSAISIDTARQLQFVASDPVRMSTMNGTDVVPTVIIPSLGVASSIINNIRAPTLLAKNMGADGILGIDSLQNKRILIDFRTRQMSIAESAAPEVKDEPDVIIVLAKSKFGQLILVDADVGGRKLSVILDTGAQNSVGNSVLRSLVAKDTSRKQPIPIALIGVTGDQTMADFTSINKIRIGGFSLTNVPVAFADAHPFKKFKLSRKPALLLGMDVLRKFDRVSIDFAKREIKFLLPREPKS
jgi:predicted aspartyl protease